MILAVSKWKKTFEKADLCTYKSLTWISCPVSFNSTGYQNLLDTFDPMRAAALYGAWIALLQIAAVAQVRGQLSGQKGEPYTPSRLSRLSGLPVELFVELLPWATEVGWLVPVESPSVSVESPGITAESSSVAVKSSGVSGESPGVTGESPGVTGESSGDLPCVARNLRRYRTGQDRTEQNRTGQDGTGRAKPGPARPGPIGETPKNATQVIADLVSNTPELQELQSHRITPDASAPDEMTQSVFVPLRASDVLSKPPLWWAGVWYKRQLAAPDPVLRGCNAAEAAVVVALAMSLAKLPESAVKKSRTSMLISLLTKGAHGLPSRVAPCLPAAVDLLRKQLEKRTAAEVA